MDDPILHQDDLSGNRYPQPEIPVEEAWARMQSMLAAAPKPAQKPAVSAGTRLLLLIGAGAILVAGWWYAQSVHRQKAVVRPQLYASEATPVNSLLPGGQQVYLDSHSLLLRETNNQQPRISLQKGGAYFGPDLDSGTLIKAGSLEILPGKVRMYIAVDSISGGVTIQVDSGTVLLSNGTGQLSLSGGESVQYDAVTQQFDGKKKGDSNRVSYATLIFEFNSTPVPDALTYLGKAYGMQITGNSDLLKNCRFTSRFDHKPIQEVLDIMAFTVGFTYTIDEQHKVIRIHAEKGCA